MRIINTSKPLPSDPLGQLAYYSGMDNLSLYEINAGLDNLLTPSKRKTYEFEMELQAALLEMSFNGVLVDQPKRREMVVEHEKELRHTQTILHELCLAIGYYDYYIAQAVLRFSWATGEPVETLPRTWAAWLEQPVAWRREIKLLDPNALAAYHKALKTFGPPYLIGNPKKGGAFNGNSSGQKLRLFYDFFGSPKNSVHTELSPEFTLPYNQTHGISEIRTRTQKNEWTPSTDRECLEKIQSKGYASDKNEAYYWALLFISCCLEIADITKTLGFLRCRLDKGYFKSSFGAVTETGRLNSKENAQGYGSNGQNITPRLRHILCAEPGWKIAAPDYAQIESRMVGAICFQLFGATAYLNATECGDLHSLTCSIVWSDLPWPEDFTLEWLAAHGPFPADMIKAAKKIAGQEFYRGKSRRDLNKTLGHAKNYRSAARSIAHRAHLPPDLVEHYYQIDSKAFPEKDQWHRWVAQQLQTTGKITTLLGRTRQFFGRPNDDTTLREAIAFEPQSLAADYTNRALLAIYKAQVAGLPLKIFLQKHDEIGVRYLGQNEELICTTLYDIMENHITLTSPSGETRDFYIPIDMTVGWNLGHRMEWQGGKRLKKPLNPDGLIEYTEKDTRVRQEMPNKKVNLLELAL